MSRWPVVFLALACVTFRRGVEPQYRNVVDLGTVTDEEAALRVRRRFAEAAFFSPLVTLRIDSRAVPSSLARDLEDEAKRQGSTVACVVDGTAQGRAAALLQSPLCDVRLATARSTVEFVARPDPAEARAEALALARRLTLAPSEYEALARAGRALSVDDALKANALDGLVEPSSVEPP